MGKGSARRLRARGRSRRRGSGQDSGFDILEPTRVDIPSYPHASARRSRDEERDRDTALIARLPRRSIGELGLAFLSGFGLATLVVYLAMR
jgi:hypothetical protein